MPKYSVMRQAIWDPEIKMMRPAIIWVYGQAEGIRLGAPVAYLQVQQDYEARFLDARQRGFSWQDIWDYWAANGGNGYFNIRTQPEYLDATDIDTVLQQELAKIDGNAL